MDIKILENLLQVTIDRGNLRTRHHQVIQKRIMVNLGLVKSGKLILSCANDREDPTSWGASRESQPGFSHEENHHDGTAQSIVNEVIPSDRTGQPVVIPQREAWPQQFVIGKR